MRIVTIILAAIAGASLAASAADFAAAKAILQENCVKCHGGAKTKGGFRMTSAEAFAEGGYGGIAVDRDKPADSLLLKMIAWADEDHQMPPEKPLAADKVATLKAWVMAGAPYPADATIDYIPAPGEEVELSATEVNDRTRNYWAFKKVSRPPLPTIKDADWARQPVDYFIKAKLEEKGLSPAPEAPKAHWIRRAYYNLIGLPPTVAEVDAFVNDGSPNAYEQVVDRLLAMPQYGEKWGRHWLDVVRYAESNGYERDKLKPEVWRYRDYVIDAFNKDKPYDRFLIEQLAGDELPDANAETLTATGYYHLGLFDDEPADPLLSYYDGLDDVLKTTTEGMLGITMACARCHSHKIDPLPQEDYYRMMAFFRNIERMRGKGGDFGVVRTLSTPEYQRKLAAKQKRERELNKSLAELRDEAMKVWRQQQGQAAGDGQRKVLLANGSGDKGQQWRYQIEKPAKDWFGLTFDDSSWPSGESGFGTKNTPGTKVRTVWQGKNLWIRRSFRLTNVPKQAFWHLHHDEDVEIYINGIPAATFGGYTTGYTYQPLSKAAMQALQVGKNVIAVRCKQTIGGQYLDVGIVEGPGRDSKQNPMQVMRQHGQSLLGAARFADYQRLEKELGELRKQKVAGATRVLAVHEENNNKTHLLRRGNPQLQGREVQPGFPSVLGFPDPEIKPRKDSSGRRIALAEWIASPENPLTPRVMVNRVWQHHFGRGIVRTPSDFGNIGAKPTHPELLNWLAAEFVESGWRLKRLHKMLMLSSTYRMAVTGRDEALVADPGNDTFWRFNPRRLTAEEVRDSVIHVSGELNLKMGGPGMYPKLPEAVLRTASNNKWGKSPVEEQRRRSIYAVTRRSLLVPILTDHDKADTDNPCPVRFSSVLPTQALGMLNSDFVNEQALTFADRLRREQPGDTAAQVAHGFSLAFSRPATSTEIERGLRFLAEMQQHEQLSEKEALDRFALLLLNLNEFVFVD